MPLPLVRYKVIQKDPAGLKVAEFDNWRKLSYEKRVNDVGSYDFEINGWDDRISLFELDGQLEVFRADLANDLDWYLDFEGLHRSPIRKTSEEGDRIYNSIGVGYNDLAGRRVIGYKSGTVRAVKKVAAETAMKEYVSENCGSVATIARGRLHDGVVPGLMVEASRSQGIVWSGDRAFENLLDVLNEIAEFSGIDFAFEGFDAGLYVFKTYLHQLGTDRTIVGLNTTTGLNLSGVPPTIFSIDSGTVRSIVYSFDRLKEANCVYVLGQGDGSTRKVILRDDPLTIDDSPMNLREVSRPASKNEFEYQLKAFGDEVLVDTKAIEAITFEHLQQSSVIYGRDFFLGDRITVHHEGQDYNKRIVAIQVSIQQGVEAERITLEFSDLP